MKKVFTGLVILSLIVYFCILYFMLFAWYNRTPVLMSEKMKLNYAYNLIPLKTIAEYTKDLIEGSGHALLNLAGNLFLLLPLGFYLPFLVAKANRMRIYAIAVTVFILAVEVAQLITFTGSLDVDDYILNFAGALMGFWIFKHIPIRKLFEM